MLVVAVPLGAGGGRGAAVVCRLELHSECGLANRPEAAPGVLGAEFLYVDADEVVRGACHLSACLITTEVACLMRFMQHDT